MSSSPSSSAEVMPTSAPASTPPAPGAPLALPLPSKLFVPLPSDAAEAVLPPGTRVAPAQPLLRETAGASHVPLAPVAGVVGGVTRVQLLGGRPGETAALEIDVDLAAPPPEPRAAGDA